MRLSFLMIFLRDLKVMQIGYVRVSKSDGSQSLDLQKDALIQAGIESEYIYEDLASGRKDYRPGLEACLKALQPGNTLTVWKLDRLGRNLKHLVDLVDELKNKNIGFKVLTGQGANIDTTTPNGKLVFGIFAALAEFERDLIIERTRAGLKAARARGRKGGRPRKVTKQVLKMAMTAMSDRNSIATDVAKDLGVTPTTLYMYVNGDGTLKEVGLELMGKVDEVDNHITKATKDDYDRLLQIWENSVRATHLFLKGADIQKLKSLVAKAFSEVSNLFVYKDKNKKILGFIGVKDKKIEMLFIDAKNRRKGIGKILINYAIASLDAISLNVNEQNPEAVEFYKYIGFKITGRSELDNTGNPFPLLHMELNPKNA